MSARIDVPGAAARGGWQSNDNLHKDKRFSEILESISKYFQFISKNYGYVEDMKLFITNMWANVNRYKDYNVAHIHQDSDWSFVYYVEIPEDSGNLILLDPRIRRKRHLGAEFIKNYDNPFTHDIYIVSPLAGKFVIFPSYLEHHVKFNTTNKPRISISGNIIVEKA